MRIAFDMSSFMWTALFAGKDTENGFEAPHPTKADKKIWVNSALYGYENVINMMVSALDEFALAPISALLVFEGMHGKRQRRLIDTSYKEGEDKAAESYVEFEALKGMMVEVWKNLGATVISQDHVEGDDVLAYLARETEDDLVIATGDRDLCILNGKNEHGAAITVRYGNKPYGVNPYGPWDLRLIPVYKALVGDAGDKIKGVTGFGDAKWCDMLVEYGEDALFQIQGLLEASGKLGDLHTQVEEDKKIKMICEQEAQCYRSYLLGKLHPEWVNTLINPLKIEAGMVKGAPGVDAKMPRDERLEKWYAHRTLITAKELTPTFFKRLGDLVGEAPFVAFDIETSTPPESDEWVDAQNKRATDPEEDRAVDTLGSRLTGFSLTLGENLQHTFYFSVDHADTDNISMEQARNVLELVQRMGKEIVLHNHAFELVVIYLAFAEHWQDNTTRGFIERILDTMLECSYVDENIPRGLKFRSKHHLGYEQATFESVTLIKAPVASWTGDGDVCRFFMDKLPRGGVLVRDYEAPDIIGQLVDGELQYPLVPWQDRRFKMNELPATRVFDYGCDDTICTAALHVYAKLVMELEHTWKIYKAVEIDAAYQHAANYLCGMKVSIEKSNELAAIDDQTYEDNWKILRQCLIDLKYDGTEAPEFGAPLEPADIKQIFEICCKRKLDTMIRTPAKLVTYIRDVENEPTLALMLDHSYRAEKTAKEAEVFKLLNEYVAERFTGEPVNPLGSPKQMAKLLFEVMGLPIRVRNKATDKMRATGNYEGSPKTDALAIEYALQKDATPEQKKALEALKLMQMVRTRRGLYYSAYPYFVHWMDGMVHPSHNQSSTNTRRASESKPNKQQLPKHQKIEGQLARYREVVVPHRPGAVVVSMDFESQELKIIASWSGDEVLMACYVGENKKDVHALTGLGIFNYKVKKRPGTEPIDYDRFMEISRKQDKTDPLYQYVKDDRALGKKTNFTTEFGAMAPKVAQTLIVEEEEAQAFIDAREAAFPRVKTWKEEVIQEARDNGYVCTMLGARRHLREALRGDKWTASKAERQGVNFKVQGSAAEMTKKAESRMWRDGLFFDFDAVCYGPVHDEVVASVMIEDLFEFIPRMHACMVGHYSDKMIVPITSSISFGWDFFNQIEIGAEPTREAVEAGIAKLREKQ